MYFDHSLMFISLYIVDVNDRQQSFRVILSLMLLLEVNLGTGMYLK
jgi:hypothetical protein